MKCQILFFCENYFKMSSQKSLLSMLSVKGADIKSFIDYYYQFSGFVLALQPRA